MNVNLSFTNQYSPRYARGFILRPTFFVFKLFYRLTIFSILILGFSKYWLPLIPAYKQAVEAEASSFLDNIVTIGRIQYEHQNSQPRWILHNVKLQDKFDSTKQIKIAQLSLRLDTAESLRTMRFQPAEIHASGVEATITQNKQGEFHLDALALPIAGFSSGEGREKPLYIQVDNSTLHWVNKKNNGQLSLHNVTVSADITGQHINAKVNASPLASIGKPLRITAQLQQHAKYWQGQVNIQGEINNPSALPIDLHQLTGIIDGDLRFKLTSHINKNRPTQITGQVSVNHPVLEQALHTKQNINSLYHRDIDHLRIKGLWSANYHQKTPQWKAKFTLEISKDKQKRRSKLNFSQKFTDNGFQLTVGVDRIDLNHYLPLLERQQWLNNKIAYYLRKLKPRGQLKDFTLFVQVNNKNPLATQVQGKGHVSNISIQAHDKIPALQKINADFDFDRDTGTVHIYSKNNQIDYPRWFEAPIQIEQLKAQLTWQRTAKQWLFSLNNFTFNNQDAQAEGTGKLILAQHKSPFIDLELQFAGNRLITHSRNYIPAIIPKGGEQWLKTAIKSAIVPRGGLKLKGKLKQFPFVNGKGGEFLTWFDIEKGQLAYLPNWPILHNMQGRVSFINAGMHAKIESAEILDNKISSATVRIDNFRQQPILEIKKIRTVGKLTTQLNLLKDSPLGQAIRPFLNNSKFSGNADLELSIQAPLHKGMLKKENVLIDGKLELKQVNANLQTIRQEFNNIKGTILFNQDGLSANKLSTHYKNRNANISINTSNNKQNINILLQQKNNIKSSLVGIIDPLVPYLSGETNYKAYIKLPSYSLKYPNKNKEIELRLSSNLKGIRSILPEPFNKNAQQTKALEIYWKSPLENKQSKPYYNIHYDQWLSAIFANTKPIRLGINFGKGTAILPNRGIVINGQLSHINLMQWQSFITSPSQTSSSINTLKINLAIQELFLANSSQGKAHLSIIKNNDHVSTTLESEQFNANINKNKDSLSIQLSHLNLDILYKLRNSNTVLHPKNFPSLLFTCHACRVKGQLLDTLSLSLINRGNYVEINNLSILSKYYQLLANGDWSSNDQGSSETKLKIKTAKIYNLGDFLSTFSNEIGLEEGKTSLTGNLSWLGSPFNFNLQKLSAQLELNIQQGEFSDIQIGIGKLLGLFNRSTLRKRLRLDFSDIPGKGLIFDKITGDINLKYGIATTDNMLIESSVMLAGMKGKSNLIKQTHNQVITVIPDAKSALAGIGLLLGGIGVGATLAVLDKLTDKHEKKQLNNDSIGMRYRVSGAWGKPIITDITPIGTIEDIYDNY